MKKADNYFGMLNIVFSLVVFVTACSPAVPTQAITNPSLPTKTTSGENTAQPSDTENPPAIALTQPLYSSAPQDETLDETCRITINFFFNFRKGFNLQEYRNLFLPSSQSLADAYAANPPTEPRIILVLMPSSLWWQKNFPTTPIPNIYMPEGPNEYTYYVEFTGHYESDETPAYAYPDFMTMFMVADGPHSCKIKNYGKG